MPEGRLRRPVEAVRRVAQEARPPAHVERQHQVAPGDALVRRLLDRALADRRSTSPTLAARPPGRPSICARASAVAWPLAEGISALRHTAETASRPGSPILVRKAAFTAAFISPKRGRDLRPLQLRHPAELGSSGKPIHRSSPAGPAMSWRKRRAHGAAVHPPEDFAREVPEGHRVIARGRALAATGRLHRRQLGCRSGPSRTSRPGPSRPGKPAQPGLVAHGLADGDPRLACLTANSGQTEATVWLVGPAARRPPAGRSAWPPGPWSWRTPASACLGPKGVLRARSAKPPIRSATTSPRSTTVKRTPSFKPSARFASEGGAPGPRIGRRRNRGFRRLGHWPCIAAPSPRRNIACEAGGTWLTSG